MREDGWVLYGAAAGAAAILFFVAGFAVVGTPPGFDAPATRIAAWFGDDRTRIQVGSAIAAASTPFFIWFLATVHSLTRPLGSGARRAGVVAFGCGLIAVALFLADTTALLVAALRPENMRASPELASALFDFSFLALGVGAFAFAGVFAAYAVLVLRDRALWPAWLGWAAAVSAVLTAMRVGCVFTDSGPFAADGVFGFYAPVVAFTSWIAVASLALAVQVRRG